MHYFDHEKLDVYQAAIELVVLVNSIVENLPRGRAYLADQLQRAGASIPLNIAEGAGEYSSNEKKGKDGLGHATRARARKINQLRNNAAIICELQWPPGDSIQALKSALMQSLFKNLKNPDSLTCKLSYELVKTIRHHTSDNFNELNTKIQAILNSIPRESGLFRTHPLDSLVGVIQAFQKEHTPASRLGK